MTAEFLLVNRYNLDAMYLGGYTIECTLKALILESASGLSPSQKIGQNQLVRVDIEQRIVSGAKMHNPEVLKEILKDLGRPIPAVFVERFRRYGWSTSLRYQSGRTYTGETRGFLKVARQTYHWVEGQLP